MFHDMFTRGEISCPGELSLTTIFPSKKIHNKASSQQVKFVMIRIEFIFSRFKSILLGASGEGFRKQTKEGKSLFTLRGLVSCDANKTSSERPLLHRAYFISISLRYKWGYTYSFCQIFQGLCLFKGLSLFQTLE